MYAIILFGRDAEERSEWALCKFVLEAGKCNGEFLKTMMALHLAKMTRLSTVEDCNSIAKHDEDSLGHSRIIVISWSF